jgi:hypothetical protein
MGERRTRRRSRRRTYQDYLTADPGRRRSPLRWLRDRLDRRRLVSAPLRGGRWDGPGEEDPGGAGVREPRRPLPRSPQGAAELPRD